ncbi:MAG TPA: response regulator [Candidatus Omnitrophota bacterium]|nr:response regulator [Candidatus Omnitrophota bacterium]
MSGNIKVLLSEDNDDIRKILSMRLEVAGYSVMQARDGEETMDIVKKSPPDVIILDLMMPKISGFEVCRMLKFDERYKDIPIIVLSALDRQKDREKAFETGADAYFIKPFDLGLLINKIETVTQKRG